MYLNEVKLIGNLTRDPEIKALPSGQQVANFSVATNRTWKDKEGKKQEAVEYHNCVAFGRTAEVIGQYIKKGHQILITGRLQTRSWDSEGKKQYRTEVVVDNFQFGNKPAGSTDTRNDREDRGIDTDEPHARDPLEDEFNQAPADEANPEDIPF